MRSFYINKTKGHCADKKTRKKHDKCRSCLTPTVPYYFSFQPSKDRLATGRLSLPGCIKNDVKYLYFKNIFYEKKTTLKGALKEISPEMNPSS